MMVALSEILGEQQSGGVPISSLVPDYEPPEPEFTEEQQKFLDTLPEGDYKQSFTEGLRRQGKSSVETPDFTALSQKFQADTGKTPYEWSVQQQADESLINELPPVMSDFLWGVRRFIAQGGEQAGLAMDKLGVPNPEGGGRTWADAAADTRTQFIEREGRVADIDREGRNWLMSDIGYGAQMLGEVGTASATLGSTAVLPYIGLTERQEGVVQAKQAGLSDEEASAFGNKRGLVAMGLTFLGNKYLGGGIESGSQGIITKAVNATLGKMAPKAMQPLVRVVGQSQAEAAEEVATEAATWLLEQEAGIESGPLKDRLLKTYRMSTVAGGMSEGVRESVTAFADYVEKGQKNIKRVAQAIQEAQTYEGEVPPTDREGFQKATGKSKTSQVEREAFAETVRAKKSPAKGWEVAKENGRTIYKAPSTVLDEKVEAAKAENPNLREYTQDTLQPEVDHPQVDTPPPESPRQLAQSDPEQVRIAIQSIIPSSKAIPQEDGGYRVELPNGQFFTLEMHEEIPLRDSELKSVLKQYGLEDTKENRQKLRDTAKGSFTISTPDGSKVSGMGVVRLAARLQKDGPQRMRPVIRHEAFHLARQLGLITDAEFQALREKHAPGVKNDAQAEEKIARASEAWEGERGLLAYLRDAFDRLLAKLGLRNLSPRSAERAFVQGNVFYRSPKPQGEAVAARASALSSLSASPLGVFPEGRNYLVPLSDYTDTVYHETNVETLVAWAQGTGWSPFGMEIWVSNNPDLATGQRNKTGVVLEYATDNLPGKISTAKPTWKHSWEKGDAEFVSKPESLEQLNGHLKRVTIKPHKMSYVDKRRLTHLVERMASQGWTAQQNEDGSVTYSKPQEHVSLSADPEGEYPDRFLGRANVSIDQRARQAMSEHDVAQGAPERRARAEAVAEADARLATNYQGELQKFLGDIENAEKNNTVINLNEADVVTVRRLLSDLGVRMFEGDEQARKLHRTLSRGYRDARTEAARALGVRDPLGITDPNQTPVDKRKDTIAEALNEESLSTKKKRKKARTKQQREEIDRESDAEWERVRKRLEKLGWDLSDIERIAADPDKSIRFIQDASTAKSTWWDVGYEYWKNAILSGTQTHIVNGVGNATYSFYDMTVERAAEAVVNLFVKDPKSAQLGEFRYLLGGIGPGLVRATRNAFRAFATESAAFQVEMGRAQTEFEQGSRKAIPGKLGRGVRIPYRMLMFADEFAKSLTATMEVGAQAYRIAKAEGLSGAAMQQRIADLTNDIESDAWSLAIDKSTQLAFQGEGGVLSSKTQKGAQFLRSHIPGTRWVIPFVTTPANILESGIRRTPILGALLDYADARNRGHHMTDSGMSATLARQAIGVAGMLLLMGMNDPEDPWITGVEDEKDRRRRGLAYGSHPPQSIRIGGTWYSYRRVEPFATAIAATVDGVNALRRGDPVGVLLAPASQLTTKTYLDGLGDLENAYRQGVRGNTPQERAEGVAEWSTNFAGSWVPNIIRQASRNARAEYAERRVWGKGNEYWQRLLKRAAQGTEFRAIPDEARFDVWGRPIINESPTDHPVTDLVFRTLSPVKVYSTDRMMDADLALYRWNALNPTQQIYWEPPSAFYREDGETKYLTDEQYARYTELSGLLARKYVERVKVSTENPTEAQVERLKKAVAKGRSDARKRLKRYWKQGEDGANEVAKLKTPAGGG